MVPIIIGETLDSDKSEATEKIMIKKAPACSSHPIYQHLRVAKADDDEDATTATTTKKPIRILCFVMTHSGYHDTRVSAVWKTWGPKCDSLLVSSNVTDPSLNALAISADGSYLGLWEKLNTTLQYIYNNHFAPAAAAAAATRDSSSLSSFDWILKADDDTYVVMENLRSYLSSISERETTSSTSTTPIILGRRYASPRYRNLKSKDTYFNHSSNRAFGRRFYQKINKNKPVFYNYGGAGYVMNRPYLERFVQVATSTTEDVFLRGGQPPEDQALGVVMAYHDIWPRITYDDKNRDRFHMEAPWTMYDPPALDLERFNRAHKAAGVWKRGFECCAPESITFHHLTPQQMMDLDHQLYHCPLDY
jgi:glycoprotein-N-acetylgalactosamine 3-beta-galactosyltransferase